MDKETLSIEEYELLSDEEKPKYYKACLFDFNSKKLSYDYRLWSVRRAESAKYERPIPPMDVFECDEEDPYIWSLKKGIFEDEFYVRFYESELSRPDNVGYARKLDEDRLSQHKEHIKSVKQYIEVWNREKDDPQLIAFREECKVKRDKWYKDNT